MSLQGLASLTVATFELKAVQSVIGAMRAADAASGKPQAVTALGPDPSRPLGSPQPRPKLQADARIEPGPVFRADPRIEPSPKFTAKSTQELAPPAATYEAPVVVRPLSVLPPPWSAKSAPADDAVRPVVKPRIVQVDIHQKGAMIDLFI